MALFIFVLILPYTFGRMAVRVSPAQIDRILAQTLLELTARRDSEEVGSLIYNSDIVDWAQQNYFIPSTMSPIKLLLHQIAILRYMFTRRDDNHFPAQTLIYSTVKKSGKTTIGGVVGRWFTETQSRFNDIYCCGNDLTQATEREFLDIRNSIALSPGFDRSKEVLPGRWRMRARTMQCVMTGSRVRAVSVDAKGEAGGAPALSVWTELWGFDTKDATRFWEEMTPAPTLEDSIRLVETYAGFDDGSSKLLYDLYDMGLQGHQLTAGELAAFVCREDTPGQTFQDFVNCWAETKGDPTVKIPLWHNEQAGLIMYWDSGLIARRMPWQQGERGERYYREQVAGEPPDAYRRHHLNEWTGAESAFIPIELWDACGEVHKQHDWEPIKPLLEGDRTPLIIGADGAVSGDCFGIVAVTRCPHDTTAVDIKAYKKWDPAEEGGFVDFSKPEEFLRIVPKVNNVVQIAYDPFQLADMMQRLMRDFVAWCEPFSQGSDRLLADSRLYDLIINRRIHHSHQPEIREHIANANKKLQASEDSKLRIVKKSNGRKIDLAVALSMASHRCLVLTMENA